MTGEDAKHSEAIATRRDKTAADIYRVQPDYQRFNQKNNMTRQSHWNPEAMRQNAERFKNLNKLMASNRPGYRLEDWALQRAASTYMANNGFEANRPNRRGNSWMPVPHESRSQTTAQPFQIRRRMEPDPPKASRLVAKAAREFGADDVSFAFLDRRWVYSHWYDEETKKEYPIKFSDEPGYGQYTEPVQLPDMTQVIPQEMRYAVIMIHEMDEAGIATAPTLTQSVTVTNTYSQISFTTVSVAEFIRGLGYNAIPSANCTALSIPLAIDAGLGELGRNAKLIHPRFGPRCRISKIITDLPLETSQPRLWGVTEFCNVCQKCARACPAGAIPPGDRSFEPVGIFNNRGVLQWQMDHMKCREYWSKVGTNCGICIRVCPFNKPDHRIHDWARWLVRRRNRAIDAVMVRMDDILGYGKFRHPDDFWNS